MSYMNGKQINKFEELVKYCKENNIIIPEPKQQGENWVYDLADLNIEQLEAIRKIWN